ncbi:hypothetical protein EVAR_39578_1 [Eumeta japonica]|uniref:Uncharacterized protein n=1 Tax=Eumeta variegata TaxID=151549 RepID=A0A4C1XNV4_EUMVA|nr:hypothetical protein EVAR_39578_1 [Eumeta japonica]
MRAFSTITNIPNCKLHEVFVTIEEFVCRVYGLKFINDVSATRVASFLQNYQIIDNDDLLNWKKRIDGAIFPPCHSELRQHLLRTSYIAHLWSRAYHQDPTELSPTDWGWEEREGKYGFKWFEGDQVPPSITSITDSSENIAEDQAADNEQDEEQDIAQDSSDDDASENEYDSDSTIDDK